MGTDDIFKKRKANAIKVKSHKRRLSVRNEYEKVLIVCEGEKTEKNYFDGLKNLFKINLMSVKVITSEYGSAPSSVVAYALDLYKKNNYDRVFCVFDKDSHSTYSEALEKVKMAREKKRAPIYSFASVPCIEFWFLLHFGYTSKPYVRSGVLSPCQAVIKDLRQKNNFHDYEKGMKNIANLFESKAIDDAIRHARALNKFHRTSGTDNPCTKIYLLVEYFKKYNEDEAILRKIFDEYED